jgi:hypothetical protein
VCAVKSQGGVKRKRGWGLELLGDRADEVRKRVIPFEGSKGTVVPVMLFCGRSLLSDHWWIVVGPMVPSELLLLCSLLSSNVVINVCGDVSLRS